MKKSYVIKSFYLIALVFLFACSKSETPNPNGGGGGNTNTTSITVSNESNVGETGFTANWSVNKTGISNIKLQIALTDEFSNLIKDITVPITANTIEVSDLTGATSYYYKIIISFSDNTSVTSSIQTVSTTFEMEEVSFTTSDGYLIKGEIAYLASNTDPKPGLIMMHEYNQSRTRWTSTTNTKLRNKMIAQGYVCLAFDFRGHGSSEAFERAEILSNRAFASYDLIAAINFMKSREEVNNEKFALIGGSIGAIMAVAGNGYDEVKTSVALSANRNGIYTIFPSLSINSAFYIAGDLDKNEGEYRDFEAEANLLYSMTTEPKKLSIISGEMHGVDLLTEDLEDEIVDWINSQIDL